jgi:NAD(P)-dependent dehydrogenase (short-subunit alcohol dehydrogenase family)
MLVKTLADELGPRGVRVNALLPGRIATDRLRELDGPDPAVAAGRAASIPLRRYGEPAELGPGGGVPALPRRLVRHRRPGAGRRRRDACALSGVGLVRLQRGTGAA